MFGWDEDLGRNKMKEQLIEEPNRVSEILQANRK